MTTTQRALAVGVGAALLQALMLIAFAWPAANIARAICPSPSPARRPTWS
ncbi:hypothetical protein ACIA8C_32680 [Nocardia sp. NPDC051321]